MAPVLRTVASLLLILPSCLLASIVVGLQVLTTVPWDVLVGRTIVLISWSPLVLAGIAGVLATVLLLLFWVPALGPLLLLGAGLSSSVILIAAAPLWAESGDFGEWWVVAFGLAGTTLAAWQVRTSAWTRCTINGGQYASGTE